LYFHGDGTLTPGLPQASFQLERPPCRRAGRFALQKSLVAAVAFVGLASLAQAGGQQVVAWVSDDGQSVVVRTHRCGTPSSLALRGTAEGLVGGERRSRELAVTPGDEPGVFRVARQWPAEGRRALVLSVIGQNGVSTLVTLEPGASQISDSPNLPREVWDLDAISRPDPSVQAVASRGMWRE
jgi:hypothetical protein